MEGKRLIEKIRLRNILSFGDKGEEIELQPLNVIIGQNASGKSNFIDVIKLLKSLPQDKGLVNYISRNGGINEWIWKGKKTEAVASINAEFWFADSTIRYEISFSESSQRISIVDEKFFEANGVELFERVASLEKMKNGNTLLSNSSLDLNYSRAEFIYLRGELEDIVAYTDLQTSRHSEIRKPQIPDAPNDFLDENATNLSLVLNDLEFRDEIKQIIIENLQKFYPRFDNYLIRILGGTIQLFFREKYLNGVISARRLSNGTFQYLCLLAILCHPEPPPLICIEEPETGLHPDILPTIGELLIEASKRTQLIVTTHSDILVSSFSEIPEAVLVCEADEDGTHLQRLEREKLKSWLEEYQLGDLWIRGEIGGKRW